ncbi:F-box/LRR-repeat protein 14 [Hibiscus syriacus]|uniref:F-box/LRR-repeat protein 14 n=1 Tax=Hibiscus syriacus TaxID=106335 RepID=A0A6A2ZU94_HIBSY|nr:F-box/LRR-repeat protein 14 [Hibiscus syriacus]
MDELPEHVVWEILGRIRKTEDRNSVSLACKSLYEMDNEQRISLRVGCGLDPANEALASLCIRFSNLTKVEITYSGWMSKLGKQMDDQGLSVLAGYCPLLSDFTLSYCTFVTDIGLRYLASCSKLSALKLNFNPRITGCGILSLVEGCRSLAILHLIHCLNVNSVEWLEYLGKLETLEDLSIKNFRELRLVNCIISPGRGLACVLGKFRNLEKIHLDMCIGARDSDTVSLAQKSSNLLSISLPVPSDFSQPLLMNNPLTLTDESLKATAQNCLMLEIVIQNCPVRELALDHVNSFTDIGMKALCSAQHLETLELERCQEISDEGLQLVSQFPCLRVLQLRKCLGITDDGFRTLFVSYKSDFLAVDDSSQISERAIYGAARSISFGQDLSWMY